MNIQTQHRRSVATAGQVRVAVVSGFDGFQAMASDWNDLFARCGQPQQVFQSHRLLSLWAKAYGELARGVVVVAAYRDDRLIAALPLIRRKRFGLAWLQFMGARIAQFDDALIDPACDPATLDLLWAAVAGLGGDYLEARRIRADAAFRRLGGGKPYLFEQLEAPFACLASRVDEDGAPGEAYSPKERSNYRRRLRRLGERGTLALVTHNAGAQAVAAAMEALAMKRRFLRRIGVVHSAVFAPEFASFFAGAAADPASGLLVSAIEIEGRPIAIDLSFICKETGFGHVLASDPDYEREAAGSLLVHHVFAKAREAGAQTFDLLAPADPYKLRHADGATAVDSFIYAFSWKGWLAAAFYTRGLPLARQLARLLARSRSERPSPPQD